MPLDLAGIAARNGRLAALTLELLGDQRAYREDPRLPLLYVERRELVDALAAAVDGIESARVVLARARMRLEAGRGEDEVV